MSSPQKAKRVFSNPQREQILREHLEHGLSISAISRKHQISSVTLYGTIIAMVRPGFGSQLPIKLFGVKNETNS